MERLTKYTENGTATMNLSENAIAFGTLEEWIVKACEKLAMFEDQEAEDNALLERIWGHDRISN